GALSAARAGRILDGPSLRVDRARDRTLFQARHVPNGQPARWPFREGSMPLKPLIDTQGRAVRDLRISVTDRCNLRCVYCMPAEGMPWLPKDDLLTYEEIARFARVCIALGVNGVRLTGGEPTVRADLPVLVRMLSGLAPGLGLS